MARVKIFSALAGLSLFIASCTAVTSPATVTGEPPKIPPALPTTVPTILVEETPAVSPTGLPQTDADVPRVSVQDAAAAIQSGEAVIVDVRSAQAYQQSHIPGALSIPLFDIEKDPAGLNLDKEKWIITYCT